uniref:Protein amnionless n=1 Tax=Calidris pygmaea TaxID=425635 RepID=A0A8C3JYR3_9CHAR
MDAKEVESVGKELRARRLLGLSEALVHAGGVLAHRVFLLLPAAATAVYKQWIPNTNFETASNWDKGRVPCASDVVHFEKNKVSDIFIILFIIFILFFVKCHRALKSPLYLPLNGEFVLASGAGFAAFDGSWDPGATVRFADAEHQAWFDPTLWQPVSPNRELELGGRIFSVDEERVPCHYDDVIFQPETSFRVNVDSSRRVIHLRSISLMGQEFSSPEAWAGYLGGPSAPLQFHGNGTLQVTGTGCPEKSGCACGNAPDGHRICAALGRQCPALTCRTPLQPLGHCCEVCGEWGAWPHFCPPTMPSPPAPFPWLHGGKLGPKYAGVQMAISKVHKEQTFLGIIPQSPTPLIQIVLVDDEAGAQTGTAAEQMAADIMEDIAQHGNTSVLLSRSPTCAPKATTVQSFLSPTSRPLGSLSSLPFHQGMTWELSGSLVEAP